MMYRKTLLTMFLLAVMAGCGSSNKNSETHAGNSNCKVLDPDIDDYYDGPCKDGLAEGEGKARGRDEYTGYFHLGEPHGRGTYRWGPTSDWPTEVYEGQWDNGDRTGYGAVSVDVNSIHKDLDWYKDNSVKEGDRYVIRGYRYKQQLVFICESEESCFRQFVEAKNLVPADIGNSVQSENYLEMNIDDLRLDMAALKGKMVKVSAIGLYLMDTLYLKRDPADFDLIPVEFSKVNRQSRMQVIQSCGQSGTLCRVSVIGIVGSKDFLPRGISATNIIIED